MKRRVVGYLICLIGFFIKFDHEIYMYIIIDDFESWHEDEEFPIQDEYKLEFEIAKEGITIQDYNFDKLFNNECNKSFIDTIDEEVMDEIYDDDEEQKDGCTQHKIGGYPFFAQQDPREGEKSLRRFDTLLLQIDTEEDEGIVWGDCGVCNFFINSEDLKNKDFSVVNFDYTKNKDQSI
ncbi:YwqG family protein [Romboutsia lituseburensis]|uniref:YwqG family protein n=1 Tax=Romboutsia lituseburensis TaxID=1537 RepID=UPI00215B3012|nr:YwqG family protein [Romboutsia lituseburensis]MCR8746825.1 YwqG family protein [Romboutsia lituseburensis]